MRSSYSQLTSTLKASLPGKTLCSIGRSVGFIQRLRDLRAGAFVWSLVLSRFSSGRPGFTEAKNFYARLTRRVFHPRPFQMRVKSAGAVQLLENAFQRMVRPWQEGDNSACVKHPLARHFSDILIVDSTIVHLHDSLRRWFKGLRTAVASMKITLTISAFGALPLCARLAPGTRHDAKLLPDISLLRPSSLLLLDRGFIRFETFAEYTEKGVFFLCPMKSNGNARILEAYDAPKPVKQALRKGEYPMLRSFLPRGKKIRRKWDLRVILRRNDNYSLKNPITARLLVLPGPKGEQRSYLTNLPMTWKPEAIRELYRLRWQIELVFKEMKQHLNLECMPSKDPNAVQVFAWASLLALALSRMVSKVALPWSKLGARASHRLALVTRALTDMHHLLLYAMKNPDFMPCFIREIRRSAEVSKYERARVDSFERLRTLSPSGP